jgi:hypothetical protein
LARIFFALAIVALLAILAVNVNGFLVDDYNSQAQRMLKLRAESREGDDSEAAKQAFHEHFADFQIVQDQARWHTLFGTAATLIALLVNCLSVTYFVGTCRWCLEVVETYRLDPELAEISRGLKRRNFPFAVAGFFVLVVIVATGAAADPFANTASPASWLTPHWVLSIVGLLALAACYWVQVAHIGAHYEIIEQILSEVKRIRRDRGMDEDGDASAETSPLANSE